VSHVIDPDLQSSNEGKRGSIMLVTSLWWTRSKVGRSK
jgi:hypothetical protein